MNRNMPSMQTIKRLVSLEIDEGQADGQQHRRCPKVTSSSKRRSSLVQQLQFMIVFAMLIANLQPESTVRSLQLQQDLWAINTASNASQTIRSSISLQEADSNQLFILGLFDLHKKSGPIGCGELDLDVGEQHSRKAMQNLEAFLWAIEQVNANATLLPGVKLGSLALDTCSSLGRTYIELGQLLRASRTSQDQEDEQQQQQQAFGIDPRRVLGVVADQADWRAVEASIKIASSHNLTSFVTQSRSSELNEEARHLAAAAAGPPRNKQLQAMLHLNSGSSDKALLAELLGIGHPSLANANLDGFESPELWRPPSENAHSPMFMVRMGVSNEVLADALGGFLEKMNWTLVSLVWSEDEPDMVNLRTELLGQLISRGISLACDERIKTTTMVDSRRMLVDRLIKKSRELGARIVLTLTSVGGARQLFQTLDDRAPADEHHANNLLFLSVIDREPYYLSARRMLGSINLSSSSSLSKEFQQYFRSNRAQSHLSRNKWWPEFLASLAQEQQEQRANLNGTMCARRPLARQPIVRTRQQCGVLDLGDLIQEAQKQNVATSGKPSRNSPNANYKFQFLPSGWEHNGWEVINSVFAMARGLELVRATLCPGLKTGLCPEMSQLIAGGGPQLSAAGEELAELPSIPPISQLIYSELTRSSFQLPDGKLFSLSDLNSLGSSQLELKVKFYNLRQLDRNSIGFVKFGHYDQATDELQLNLSKAQYYKIQQQQQANSSSGEDATIAREGMPIERLRSACVAAACPSSNLLQSILRQQQPQLQPPPPNAAILPEQNDVKSATGESTENNAYANNNNTKQAPSLLMLDHPLIWQQDASNATLALSPTNEGVYLMRTRPDRMATDSANQANESRVFNLIVLAKLRNKQCQPDEPAEPEMLEQTFEQLSALSMIQSKWATSSPQAFELVITLVDECGLAKANADLHSLVGKLLESNNLEKAQELVLWNQLPSMDKSQLATMNLDQLIYISQHHQYNKSLNEKLTLNLGDPWEESRKLEFAAIIELIKSMPNWRLVHLVYTDNHGMKEHFVTQLNLAGICLSKIIWVPSPAGGGGASVLHEQDVEALRQVFSSQLHDYNDKSLTSSLQFNEALNSTRVLILLASKNDATNRMILEAASESMLEDYVWITSDEWLTSIELQVELAKQQQQAAKMNASAPRVQVEGLAKMIADVSSLTLPSNMFAVGRRLTDLTIDLRHFMRKLTPALHATIPSDLFDFYYQELHNCKLPFLRQQEHRARDSRPLCTEDQATAYASHQVKLARGDNHQVGQSMQLLESIYKTLKDSLSFRPQDLNAFQLQDFTTRLRENYENLRAQEGAQSGLNIVLRLLQPSGRRSNSRRNLAAFEPDSQLETVGFWRPSSGLISLATSGPNNTKSDDPSQELSELALDSYSRLASVRSLCADSNVCELCEAQMERSREFNLFERTQVSFLASHANPVLASSMIPQFFIPKSIQKTSQTELITNAILANSQDDLNNLQQHLEQQKNASDLQPSASSLFDSLTVKEIESNRDALVRKAYETTSKLMGGASFLGSTLLLGLMSFAGILAIILTILHVYPNFVQLVSASTRENNYQMIALSKVRQVDQINDHFLLVGLLMLYSINVAFMMPATISVCAFRRIGLASSYTLIFGAMLVKLLDSRKEARRFRKKISDNLIISKDNSRQSSQESDLPEVELSFESLPIEQQQQENDDMITTNTDGSTTTNHVVYATTNQLQDQKSSARMRKNNANTIYDWRTSAEPEGASMLIMIPCGLLLIELVLAFVWFSREPPEPTLYQGCWRCASPMRSPAMFLYEALLSLLYPSSLLILAWFYAILNYKQTISNESLFKAERISLLRGRPASFASTNGTINHANKASSTIATSNNNEQRDLIVALQSRDAKALLMCSTLVIVAWSLLTLSTISINSSRHSHIHSTIPNFQTLILNGNAHQSGSGIQIDPFDAAQSQAASPGDFGATTRLKHNYNYSPISFQQDDINLVYTNLISGAIIFISLFLYRLHLLKYLSMSKLKNYFHSGPGGSLSKSASFNVTTTSAHRHSPVMKFNPNHHHHSDNQFGHHKNSWLESTVNHGNDQSTPFGVQERLRMQQFSSYGSSELADSQSLNDEINRGATTSNTSTNFRSVLAARFAPASKKGNSVNRIVKMSGSKPKGRNRKSFLSAASSSTSLLFGSNSSLGTHSINNGQGSFNRQQEVATTRLQRRQSANSTVSSTAGLIGRSVGSLSQQQVDDIFDGGDTISVASSSASQLQGNELYPIDCSIQLVDNHQQGTILSANSGALNSSGNVETKDTSIATTNGSVDHELNSTLSRDFMRRSSRRLSAGPKIPKLNPVIEEQHQINKL